MPHGGWCGCRSTCTIRPWPAANGRKLVAERTPHGVVRSMSCSSGSRSTEWHASWATSNRSLQSRRNSQVCSDKASANPRSRGASISAELRSAASYLEGKQRFPFRATCIAPKATYPLRKGEAVEAQHIASENASAHDMLVLVRWQGPKLVVPLSQLAALDVEFSRSGYRRLELVSNQGLSFPIASVQLL